MTATTGGVGVTILGDGVRHRRLDEADAIALLLELKRHALQERFVGARRTRIGPFWDNYAVVHSATPTVYSDRDGERRLLTASARAASPTSSRTDPTERRYFVNTAMRVTFPSPSTVAWSMAPSA